MTFGSPAWWKAYAVYLVIAIPLTLLDIRFVPAGWARWAVLTMIIVVVANIRYPIQRRLWR